MSPTSHRPEGVGKVKSHVCIRLIECTVHCPFYGTHDRLYTSLRPRAQLKRLQEIRLIRVLLEHLRSEPVENVAECGRANTALCLMSGVKRETQRIDVA